MAVGDDNVTYMSIQVLQQMRLELHRIVQLKTRTKKVSNCDVIIRISHNNNNNMIDCSKFNFNSL